MARSHPPYRLRAFTLTELAIVVGIIGVIAGALWAVASDMAINQHVAITNRQLAAIVNNMRTLYAEQGSLTGTEATLTPAVDRLRVFPLEMRANQAAPDGTIFSDWNTTPGPILGNVTITAAACATGVPAAAGATNNCFGVYLYSLDYKPCVQMATAAITTATGMQGIYINGNNVATAPSLSVDVGTANANCLPAGGNVIEWVYLLRSNNQ